MKMLMEDIKNKHFKNIYLLTGEELYLRNQYRKRLRDALVAPDDTMNVTVFEGKKINPNEVIDLAETLPFFAERRVILLNDSGFVKSACPELADYVAEIPQSTCLILTESEVDKRNRLYKEIKKHGRVVEFQRQDERTLTRWILGTLKREGKQITEEALRVFFSRSDTDMQNIEQELEKLLSYTMGREEIHVQDVEAICTEQTEDRIFDMVRAVAEKKQKKALSLYADLLLMKEAPVKILALVTRQFNGLLLLKELSGKGLDRAALAKQTGIPAFRIGEAQAQARGFSKEGLRIIVEDCVKTDELVKTGQLADQVGVEMLIVKYSG
ncbi:MAG: DNA polymerase III subunit delta [Lachnospiraceae bacterium]|nr:DNA polymerase III subunit delta [Lachnospiraceae bacterium]